MACLELFFALFAYKLVLWELKQNENKATIHLKVTHAKQTNIERN